MNHKSTAVVSAVLTALLLAGCTSGTAVQETEKPTAESTTSAATETPTEEVTEPETTDPETAFLQETMGGKYLPIEQSIGYMGRWFEKEINGVTHEVTLSDGSSCYFLTHDTDSITVNFTVITSGKTPYFAYRIDGGEPVRQKITLPKINLPDSGYHVVSIIADGMTEGEGKWNNEIGFALRSVDAGEGTIKGLMPTGKTFLFFGDSITEGIRALNMNADSDGNSATNAYSWLCCQNLGVNLYNAGYGATGIGSVGSFNTLRNTVDHFSAKRGIDESFVPDAIVVNHGTNDGGMSGAAFQKGYKEAIEKIHTMYPNATVFAMVPFAQTHAADIREAVKDLAYVTLVETENWNISYTDGVHPNAAGAKIAGGKLAEAIRAKFGNDFFTEQK